MNMKLIVSALIALLVTVYLKQSAMAAQVETYFEEPGGIES